MALLLLFAFIAGLATCVSPCVLPVLPLILSAGVGARSRLRPLAVVLGFIVGFSAVSIALTQIVRAFGLPADLLRWLAIVFIAGFGLSLVFPAIQARLQRLFQPLSATGDRLGRAGGQGLAGGFILGLSLSLVWAPCVGPILASVLALIAVNRVTLEAVEVAFAYALGAGIPMLAIAYGGQRLSQARRAASRSRAIERAFGAIMLLTALAIASGLDRELQLAFSNTLPLGLDRAVNGLQARPEVQRQLSQFASGGSAAPDGAAAAVDSLDPGQGSAAAQLADEGATTGDATGAEPKVAADGAEPKAARPEKRDPFPTAPAPLPNLGRGPDFVGITRWLNADRALKLGDLRGKVVLVDFWTYTCINCIRTLPYVTAWYEKYKDNGFVVVGVHTPEFEFEKSQKNVEDAIRRFNIHYPVAQDNDYATWNNYHNRYWPAEYLIDANGVVRRVHFGEGEYEATEVAIQQLLAEAGRPVAAHLSDQGDETPRAAQTPETYLGLSRMARFASPERAQSGRQAFTIPAQLPGDSFAFGGTWTLGPEEAVAAENGALELTFTANKVFLVLRPAEEAGRVRVLLDGRPLSVASQGSDVRDGMVTVDSDRLYHLIDLHGQRATHRLRLEFQTPGLAGYAITFG